MRNWEANREQQYQQALRAKTAGAMPKISEARLTSTQTVPVKTSTKKAGGAPATPSPSHHGSWCRVCRQGASWDCVRRGNSYCATHYDDDEDRCVQCRDLDLQNAREYLRRRELEEQEESEARRNRRRLEEDQAAGADPFAVPPVPGGGAQARA